MSVVSLGKDPPKVTVDEVNSLCSKAGISVPQKHAEDFATLLGHTEQSVKLILDQEDYVPTTDLERYPRSDVHIPNPKDSDKGGWATKCSAKSIEPRNDLLRGKTVALKDNIALAGVRCTNGTEAMAWTPAFDATVATRIMDAGGTITGKATCENACLEGVSDTSCTGKVHNPYADNHSAGGSSSGSGRLVATGSVDMAIGCDQGGSIRIPSSMCGVVGLKPTWGLVPYTGIISFECTIDHAGPMAKNVRDVAVMLEAIAGSDGIDDRQPPYLPPNMLNYTSQLEDWKSSTDTAKPLAGVKIGVLKEGFEVYGMDQNIHKLCTSAVDELKELGAEMTNVSIPSHLNGALLWVCSIPIAGVRQGLFSDMSGRKQHFMIDRILSSSNPVSQKAFDALGPGAQNNYIRYLYLVEKHGPELHAKCSNLLRQLNDEYNRVLAQVDVLVMPTLPSPPCKLFDDPSAHGPLERLSRNVGLVGNTASFDSTGHPALTIPVGFVPAVDDETVKLPTGLQIVGNKFAEIECLKVGAAWEKAYDWKKQ